MPKQQEPLSPTIEEITQVFLPSPARARALISSLAEGDSLEEIEQRVIEHVPSLSRYLPGFADLESCEQGAPYHFEGNALIHTAHVFAQVAKNSHELPDEDRYLLLCAALIHDLRKPQSTGTKKDGSVSFFKHAEDAAAECPVIGPGLDLSDRDVARLQWLVGQHMNAHRILDARDQKRLAFYREPDFPLMILLQEADAKGSWIAPEGATTGEVLRTSYESDKKALEAEELRQKDEAALKQRVLKALHAKDIEPGPIYGTVQGAICAEAKGRTLSDEELETLVDKTLDMIKASPKT